MNTFLLLAVVVIRLAVYGMDFFPEQETSSSPNLDTIEADGIYTGTGLTPEELAHMILENNNQIAQELDKRGYVLSERDYEGKKYYSFSLLNSGWERQTSTNDVTEYVQFTDDEKGSLYYYFKSRYGYNNFCKYLDELTTDTVDINKYENSHELFEGNETLIYQNCMFSKYELDYKKQKYCVKICRKDLLKPKEIPSKKGGKQKENERPENQTEFIIG